jgi:hypothetical protein
LFPFIFLRPPQAGAARSRTRPACGKARGRDWHYGERQHGKITTTREPRVATLVDHSQKILVGGGGVVIGSVMKQRAEDDAETLAAPETQKPDRNQTPYFSRRRAKAG